MPRNIVGSLCTSDLAAAQRTPTAANRKNNERRPKQKGFGLIGATTGPPQAWAILREMGGTL
jgi:hypothetical protein